MKPSPQRLHPPSITRGVPALCAVLVTCLACGGMAPLFGPGASEADRFLPPGTQEVVTPVAMPVGQWVRGQLHCAEGRCNQLYSLRLDEPADLQLEVYAPRDDRADLALTLMDEAGNAIARSDRPNVRPRRVREKLEAGVYVARVHGIGEEGAKLGYEVIARLQAPAPSQRERTPAATSTRPAGSSAPRPPSASTGSREPAPTSVSAPVSPPKPAPEATAPVVRPQPATPGVPPKRDVPPAVELPSGDHVASGEVLEVERDAGRPTHVLLDVGRPQGLEAGMRGILTEPSGPIGTIELVEVYGEGSRAVIVGELAGEISIIDTVVEILRKP